jgi:hypothetical protein
MAGLWNKLWLPRIWERVLRERLAEPLHLNLLSLPVALFGSLETKIYFDLVLRQSHAFSLLEAARLAKTAGLSAFVAVEFGVAAGAGLMNLCDLARRISKRTGVGIRVVGFDTGRGMPEPLDYRDHPDLYGAGDFAMDEDALRQALPDFAELRIGPIATTVKTFRQSLSPAAPLGYVALDVDYYSSTKDALAVFAGDADQYLPHVLLYVDDMQFARHNPWQGELLAIREFNDEHATRKIAPYNFLREWRLFKRAVWISQMYGLYILDHPAIQARQTREPVHLSNPYLRDPEGRASVRSAT